MRILGIDPGTIVLGWGLLEVPDSSDGRALGPTPGRFRLLDCGVARAPRTRPLAERLAAIHLRLVAFLREGRPEQAAIEQALYGKSVASALALEKPVNRVRLYGKRLVLGNDSAGLAVLDVREPAKPVLVFPKKD
jgi:crossover junction endodeoxyribonuclease RuvC